MLSSSISALFSLSRFSRSEECDHFLGGGYARRMRGGRDILINHYTPTLQIEQIEWQSLTLSGSMLEASHTRTRACHKSNSSRKDLPALVLEIEFLPNTKSNLFSDYPATAMLRRWALKPIDARLTLGPDNIAPFYKVLRLRGVQSLHHRW